MRQLDSWIAMTVVTAMKPPRRAVTTINCRRGLTGPILPSRPRLALHDTAQWLDTARS